MERTLLQLVKAPIRIALIRLLVLAILIAPSSSVAQSLLDSAQYLFFKPGDTTRVGIESEFKGLAPEQAAAIVANVLGGKVETKTSKDFILKEIKPGGIRTWTETTRTDIHVTGTRIGDVQLKIDSNELVDGKIDPTQAVTELVTEPIIEPQVVELQKAITALKKAGARGTDLTTAVSTQVNVELAKGDRNNAKAADVLNIMRNYFRPAHLEQISADLHVPPIRQPYVQGYSPGFTKLMNDPKYNPSWRTLYDDFMYRQSLELLGVHDAWTMPIEAARAKLLSMPDPIVPAVIKLNAVRVSSMLMWMEPNDPFTKLIADSKWAYARPLVEYRPWNNDFDVIGPTREAIGLNTAATEHGFFDHDTLVAGLLHTSPSEVALAREAEHKMSKVERTRVAKQTLAVAKVHSEQEALRAFAARNSGPPELMGPAMPESTYVEVKAKRLKSPRVLWLNRELILKKYGFVIPPSGPTPAQEKVILDTWAYQIPRPYDSPDSFTSEEKSFWADRYGGDGLNNNFGSGRAASSGESSSKGIGRTPLVSPAADFDHAHGGSSIQDGMKEAVYSAADGELPNGAAQIVAIIGTGTYAPWNGEGMKDTLALTIREDDPRMAHFIPRFKHAGDGNPAAAWLHAGEWKRIADAKENILDVLPIPESEALSPPRTRYKAGVRELARRVGVQVASAYAEGIYHGTTSASNVLIDAGFIDAGTQSYHPNHAPLKMLDEAAPGGLPEAHEIIQNLTGGMNELAPAPAAGESNELPSYAELTSIATSAYQDRLREEFLTMTGVPKHLAAKLKNTPQGQQLADRLIAIAEDSGGMLNIEAHTPTQMTRYNVRPLVQDMAVVAGHPLDDIERVLEKHMANHGGEKSDPGYRKQVAREYKAFMETVRDAAAKDKIGETALWRLVKENARYARERWDLNHFAIDKRHNPAIDEYLRTGDPKAIRETVDTSIQRNRLNHSGFKPYEAVIDATQRDGVDVFRVYDAVADKEVMVMRAPISRDGHVEFAGSSMPLATASKARVQLGADPKLHGPAATIYDQKMEFRLPVPKGGVTGNEPISLVDAAGTTLSHIKIPNHCMKMILDGLTH